MPADAPATSRPGGRSARIRAAVHEAVEALIAEGGPDAATIPAVAERAGVHPTTIYRRWGNAQELVAAVAVGRLTGGLVTPDTGTLRGDLERWSSEVLADVRDPDVLMLLRAVVSSPPETRAPSACLQDRRTQLQTILDRAAERGEATPQLERLIDALLAPIYFRALFDADPAPPTPADWAAILVERALV